MLLEFFHSLKPYTVFPAAPFKHIPEGTLFTSDFGNQYLMLEQGINEIRVVQWNWATKLLWRKKLNGESANRLSGKEKSSNRDGGN